MPKIVKTPTVELCDSIPLSMVQNEEAAAKKEERETQKLDYQVEIIRLGEELWNRLYSEGDKRGYLSYQEKTLLDTAIKACRNGTLVNMMTARKIMAVKDKLESEGIK